MYDYFITVSGKMNGLMLTQLVIMLYNKHKFKQENGLEFMKYDEIIVNKKYSDINPLLLGWENCTAGHAFGPYVRTYWLLHYVSKGTGTLHIRGERHRVMAGEIFVIPPYEETRYEADREDPWSYIWIGFTSGIQLPDAFSRAVIRCPGAEELFRKMTRCTQYGSRKNAFLCSCLWELISMLPEQTEVPDNYVEKARSMIESEYMNNLKVEKIADSLSINRSYLFSLFKKQMGLSPSQYLIQVRMERAAELMTVYEKTVKLSAQAVGYQDLYNFSKIFKRHFGVSPRQYREMWRMENPGRSVK